MRRAELALVVAIVGCAPHAPGDLDGGAGDLLPPAASDLAGAGASDLAHGAIDGGLGTLKGAAKLTYYYLAEQSDYAGANDTALCDVSTAVLATVPKAFADALAIEGSGKLGDGRVLNVGGNCACSSGMTTCYIVLDAAMYPWGVGVMSRALVPYRSIAVDPAFIPFGTKVYVPELDGKQMPASYGFVHDGCLVAADTGGAIVGAHIDFFVGQKSSYLTLDAMLNLTSVTSYVSPPRCP